MSLRAGTALLGLLVLAGCAPAVEQAPPPRAAPPASPVPPPPVALAPDWQDWPLTPGDWRYARDARGSVARYAAGDGRVGAWLRCDLATKTVVVGRVGRAATPDGAVMLSVRTTFGALAWPAHAAADGSAATEAVRAANDPGLDQIAFTRGRFALELPGLPPFVLPSWAEPARVVEDCRA